jgi:hypothetical protein
MVIGDLDFVSVSFAPFKTNTPLIVDADAVLSLAIASKALQSISRQGRKRSQVRRGVKHVQFSKRLPFKSLESPHPFPVEKALGIAAPEGANHSPSVYCFPVNVNQYTSERFNKRGARGRG